MRVLRCSTPIALVAALTSLAPPVSAQRAEIPRALDATRPIPYFIAEGKPDAGYRPADRELAVWALDAWARSSAGALAFEPSPEATALIRLYWVGADGGQFGETESFSVGGRRGAAVLVRPDSALVVYDLAVRAERDPLMRDTVVYLTCVHELGHALGLAHTRDFRDIMYFFGYGGDVVAYFDRYRAQLRRRSDIARTSGLSKADVSGLQALYRPRRPAF